MQKNLKVLLSSNSLVKFKLDSNIIQTLNFVQTLFNALFIKLSKKSNLYPVKTLFESQTMFKLYSNIHSFIICLNFLVFRANQKI